MFYYNAMTLSTFLRSLTVPIRAMAVAVIRLVVLSAISFGKFVIDNGIIW